MDIVMALIRDMAATTALVLVVVFVGIASVIVNRYWVGEARRNARSQLDITRHKDDNEHTRRMYELQTEREVKKAGPSVMTDAKTIEHRQSDKSVSRD